jgi:hypothetical protein
MKHPEETKPLTQKVNQLGGGGNEHRPLIGMAFFVGDENEKIMVLVA